MFSVSLRFGLLLLLCGCSSSSRDPQKSGKPVIATVNYPLKYFAERIGGDLIEVKFSVPKEEDPDFWKPDEASIEAYQKADLILLNGATYARWTETASLSPAKCVDTSASFKQKYITIADAVTHSHGPGGEHTHTGTASLTWLDFQQAIEQAKAVRDALLKKLPDQGAKINENFTALEADLKSLDQEMESMASQSRTQPLMLSHPVFQYWTRRYGLKTKSVHWEPDEVPNEEAIKELKKLLVDHPAKWMIWEDTPVEGSVKKLQELGIQSAVFSTTGNAPEKGDFLTQMKENIQNMRAVFEKQK